MVIDKDEHDQMLPAADVGGIAGSYSSYLALKDTQKAVLIAILDDFLSGTTHTDVEIAEIAGVSRKTVYNCKRNSSFTKALTEIMPELVKAKLPKYLSQIEKHGETDYKALELLLRFCGLYVPARQQLNINASLNRQQPSMSFAEQHKAYLARLIELGWTKEQLIADYEQVKSEGIT